MEHFSNEHIMPEDLPQAAQINFTRLENDALKVWRINLMIFFGIFALVIVAIFYFMPAWRMVWAIALSAGFWLIYLILTWLDLHLSFRWSGYALREQDLLYRSGWLRRRIRIVPFKRVQHLSVVSGWIERRYGLASLRIYTAANADFVIKGLTKERANSLKAWISQEINGEEVKNIETLESEKEAKNPEDESQ